MRGAGCESDRRSGKKGGDFFRRRHWPIRDPFINIFERLSFEHAIEIGTAGTEAYISEVFDEVHVVYNEFKSAVQQRVIVEKLLPLEPFEEAKSTPPGGAYLFEPDEEELLAVLLPKHAQAQIYRILLESSAAEQAARMQAMDGATRNAGELIKTLTVYYNKTRQMVITKELMDIVGGAEALK